ncbi:hypothetical protein PHLCEN_2v8726 [Hermanssonia centrifuga]|uniref:Uncharacterized protein n=1 Tax=Hermanssonia centrifuga TaxID=98765 RepID=A0A2R6NTM2_9APHY|nr:hypothetical protein PHLCEN_2v8726 [Hermanssonia centrifuga]
MCRRLREHYHEVSVNVIIGQIGLGAQQTLVEIREASKADGKRGKEEKESDDGWVTA